MTEITFDICFTVKTDELPENISGRELRGAIVKRIIALGNDEMREACGIVDIREVDECETKK